MKIAHLDVDLVPMHTQATMPKRSSTGRLDLNQLAKSIVDQATGDAQKPTEQPEKNAAAVALGRLGGLKSSRFSLMFAIIYSLRKLAN